MTSNAGGDNRLSADEHHEVMTDDLAWAEAITLRLADTYFPEGENSKHRAA
jgi:hypothetical protein